MKISTLFSITAIASAATTVMAQDAPAPSVTPEGIENPSTMLVADTKGASQLDAVRNYAAIMALCADLRRAADEYNGTWNITMVISELENHMAAVAGLFPTWDLPTDQHLSGAHAAISKLSMGTCFGQPV